MEKKKTVKMLIARYRADIAALEEREEDMIGQIETVQNLIPAVQLWYMSRELQASESPHDTEEETKEKLEDLQHDLRQLQETVKMIKEEQEIMRRRIEELEEILIDQPEQYSSKTSQSFKLGINLLGVKREKDKESTIGHPIQGGKRNKEIKELKTNEHHRFSKKSVVADKPDNIQSTLGVKHEKEIEGSKQQTDQEEKGNEETGDLGYQAPEPEESLQVESTDWKKVCRELIEDLSELGENQKNSLEKLRESEAYVKQLKEGCFRLEKELQEKIQILEMRSNTLISEVQDRENKRSIEEEHKSKEAFSAVKEAHLEGMKSLDVFSLSVSINKMAEGEGVTPAYMQLAHLKFALKLSEYQGDKDLKEKLMNGIKQGNMAPYYKEVCTDLGWEFDSKLYDEMCAANTKRLEELEKEHAENNVMDEEDQSQLCGVWQSKLDYLCSIGDSENATALANSKVDDKTVPKSHRIDAVFSLFRISFFHGCNIKGMSTAIEKATELIEGISGGDWSARNKLKAYEGVWSLAIRDFTRAAHLFVDVVPTFESYELADFGTIIRYTVLSCMIALPRCDLRKKLMLHGVMAQALHSQYQDLREYFVSLYDGRYSDFLVCLARIEVEMKRDPLLHPHYRHYVQEMRLRAYKQILQAYRSLSLNYMAQSFGVTSEFIEREVARFAAAGRLQCKIDSVAGTVITSAHLDDSVRSKEAPEASLDRNILYQTTVKRGDILLNRLKKLARVMDF